MLTQQWQQVSYSFSRHGALFTEPPFPADFSDDLDGSADEDLVTVPPDLEGWRKLVSSRLPILGFLVFGVRSCV
jgi:hypothetical protein